MLGRGIGFGCWIVTQRADSTLFSNGARDNFMAVCALGSLSKEQKGMVFPGQEIPGRAFQAGEGMLLADGREITAVKYPLLEDAAGWKRHILGTLAGAPARGLRHGGRHLKYGCQAIRDWPPGAAGSGWGVGCQYYQPTYVTVTKTPSPSIPKASRAIPCHRWHCDP